MKNLAVKLLAFQKEVGAIPKNELNPFFKSKYADINTYLEVVKPILSKHGLVLLQPLAHTYPESRVSAAIKTTLIDTDSGEMLTEMCPLPENTDPQKMGAIITYFRRYAIQSMLCLEAEDNDGNDTRTPIKAPQHDMSTPPPYLAPDNMTAEEMAQAFDEAPFPNKPPAKQTFAPKQVGGKCPDCATGKFALNPKTGNIFCDKKCWLNKAR